MNKSDTIGELAKALSAAQAVMDNAPLDSKNPAFKRDGRELRYASLRSVLEACKPALTANELAVVQTFEPSEPTTLLLTTTLLHSSGEWISGTCSFPVDAARPGPQGYASASTYSRRYALMALLGIVGDDDDDGNAASQPAARQQMSRPESRGDRQASQEPAADHPGTGQGERQALVDSVVAAFRELHPDVEWKTWARQVLDHEPAHPNIRLWDLQDVEKIARHLTTEKALADSGKAGAAPAQVQGA